MVAVTLSDVARRLQLSVATVSRALKPTTAHLISEPVRRRIQTVATQMGLASYAGGRPPSDRTYTLGVVITTDFHSHFYSDRLSKIVEGIHRTLKKYPRYGCKLVLISPGKSLSELDRYIAGSTVDGLLMSSQCDLSVDELYDLAERVQTLSHRPVAAMNLPLRKEKEITVVTFDNRKAAEKAVSHLIRKGRRHLGLLYADNNAEDIRERIEGFKQALERHRLPLHRNAMVPGDFSVASGERAGRDLLTLYPRCDAIFCVNDEMAIGALSAIRRAGKKCPQDIAVMGFDGLASGALTLPPLSTVAQPLAEMAAVASQVLIDRIERKQSIGKPITLPATLVLRNSA